MKCIKCGNDLGENDMFCPKCGTPVQKSETNNTNVKNEGMNYNYERPVNQQINGQNYGQNYGQTNNYSKQYGNGKSNGNTVEICVAIVIIVAILAAVGFVVYSVVSALNKNNDVPELNETTVTSPSNSSISNSSTSNSSILNTNSDPISQVSDNPKSSTYKVNYAGFELYIPDDLIYEFDIANDAINIGDSLSSWVAQLSIQKIPYQQLKQNKSYLSSYFTEGLALYNATVSNVTIETIDGVEFILLEVDLAGTHEIMTIAELNSMYCACLEIANEDNDYDREILKNITPILKTAEYDGNSRNLETKGQIKTTDITSVLQKVIQEKTNE